MRSLEQLRSIARFQFSLITFINSSMAYVFGILKGDQFPCWLFLQAASNSSSEKYLFEKIRCEVTVIKIAFL